MPRCIKTSDLITSLFDYKDQDGKTHTLPNRDCDNFPIYISVEEIKKAIVKTPTADVAPVVHAHWIYLGEKSLWKNKCSLCSFETIQPHYRFCPSCGAKMDEEREEDNYED